MRQDSKLAEGMTVYSADGGKLGKIIDCRTDGFIVEKGTFFPKASMFEYGDVTDIRGGDVYLRHSRGYLSDPSLWMTPGESASLRNAPSSTEPSSEIESLSARPREFTSDAPEIEALSAEPREPVRAAAPEAESLPARDEQARTYKGEAEELCIPLAEEELSTQTHLRDLGEVRVHKRVVVNRKEFSVPLMHEEIRVDRVKLDSSTAAAPTKEAFVESTITIPLHEEELEITKHAVVREEVHVRRLALKEDRAASADVRKEEVDIEEPQALKERLRRTG